MNLLFDLIAAQPLLGDRVHGGGKYTKKLFFELFTSGNKDLNIFFLFDSSRFIDQNMLDQIQAKGAKLIDITQLDIKDIIKNNQIHRFYSALPYSIAFDFLEIFKTNCEVIVTIHGLRELETELNLGAVKYFKTLKGRLTAILKVIFSGIVYKKKYNYHARLFEKASVITVSNHSKYAIKTYFPQFKNDVKVFYSPDVTDIDDGDTTPPPEFNESGYFLLVNGNRWIKNNIRAAIALDELFTERNDIDRKVVITGVTNKDLYIKRLKNKDRFIFLNYVSEDFLKLLYQKAFAFIYITLNEGFGYPPLDAMKAGVPVIASPFTSISEVCGDAVLYCNPFATQEIKNRVLQLMDTEIYDHLKLAGIVRFNQISLMQAQHLQSMITYLTNKK
jgi:glycosyltransferase involved in cell wall biosynthesis